MRIAGLHVGSHHLQDFCKSRGFRMGILADLEKFFFQIFYIIRIPAQGAFCIGPLLFNGRFVQKLTEPQVGDHLPLVQNRNQRFAKAGVAAVMISGLDFLADLRGLRVAVDAADVPFRQVINGPAEGRMSVPDPDVFSGELVDIYKNSCELMDAGN